MVESKSRNNLTIIIIAALGAGLIGGLISGWLVSNSLFPTGDPINIESISRSTLTVRVRVPLNENQVSERVGVGIVVKGGGFIITNAHLIKGASGIFVKVSDGKEMAAKLVKADEKNDLAIIKGENLRLKPPKFSSDFKLGEQVYPLGRPFINSDNFTITSGVISLLPIDLPRGSPKLLQADAVVNPGGSYSNYLASLVD